MSVWIDSHIPWAADSDIHLMNMCWFPVEATTRSRDSGNFKWALLKQSQFTSLPQHSVSLCLAHIYTAPSGTRLMSLTLSHSAQDRSDIIVNQGPDYAARDSPAWSSSARSLGLQMHPIPNTYSVMDNYGKIVEHLVLILWAKVAYILGLYSNNMHFSHYQCFYSFRRILRLCEGFWKIFHTNLVKLWLHVTATGFIHGGLVMLREWESVG